jgi:undecaprenyl diphosphate synthase
MGAAATATLPRHVAIIMDGNGRWAARQGMPRLMGHHAGAKSVRVVLAEAARLGIEAITLYSFSSENWKRPAEEVSGLMELCGAQLRAHRAELVERGIRFRAIGRLRELPEQIQAEIATTVEATRHGTNTTLVLALNYGARAEIVDAVRLLADRVARGELAAAAIDEKLVSAALYTAGLPDPDLLIRTAGEMRLSNYLLWQISYAELHVTDVLWPDFNEHHLNQALLDFAARRRRFGGLDACPPGAA